MAIDHGQLPILLTGQGVEDEPTPFRPTQKEQSIVMDQIVMANFPSPHCDHGLLRFLNGRGVEDESAPPPPNGTGQSMIPFPHWARCGG